MTKLNKLKTKRQQLFQEIDNTKHKVYPNTEDLLVVLYQIKELRKLKSELEQLNHTDDIKTWH